MTLEHEPTVLRTANSSHVLCGAGALLKGCFAPVLVVKSRLHEALGPISARQLYATPMRLFCDWKTQEVMSVTE